MAADTIVIGAPMYNFSVPASLKAWIDLVARVAVTFRYTDSSPEGMVKGKRVILASGSSGVAAGAPVGFNTPYLKTFLGFMSMDDHLCRRSCHSPRSNHAQRAQRHRRACIRRTPLTGRVDSNPPLA
jgi:hypothetical protein